MDLRLQGHKALITGASRGIGRAIAAELLREGASVAICARQAEALDQARAQLATLGPGMVFTQTADLADTAQVRGFVTAAVDALGGLDIFIHNASAMTGPGSGEEGWRQTLAVDILAGVVGAETALAALERSTAASVVFIGSTASMEFFNGPRPYGAGKAAMRTYARELGEVWGRKGIRVNVVSLGSIDFPGSVWERVKASDPERYARAAHDAARTLRQCGRGSAGSGVCGESGGELDQRHERGRGRRPAQGGGLSQPRHALRALPPLRCSWTSPLSSSGTVMEPLPYLFGYYS